MTFVLSHSALPFCFWFSMHAHTCVCTCTHTHTHTHTHTRRGIVLMVHFYRLLSINSMSGALLTLLNIFHGIPSPHPLSEYMEPYLLRKALPPPPHTSVPPLWPCTHLRALFSDTQHFYPWSQRRFC